ncbi:hypothetical protein BsWGS_10738 [Bradybaena similaris]
MLSPVVAVVALSCLTWTLVWADSDVSVVFDDTPGFGRSFDGIGGLSGGGATSKLLINYPTKLREQILDFLFLPNFGASLQILKVEIGGDTQSTDGTEASHMHNSWEENYERGYEWWLMSEAKKRNPNIKLYGLPWGFPGWIGQGTWNPFRNNTVLADYIVRWVNGAKIYHNLTIDYLGLWNTNNYNIDYIKTLRKVLDQRGFKNVQIIASDSGDWGIAGDIESDKDLANNIYALGTHYPGTSSSDSAKGTGKPLWASEDYSTYNDEFGAGCWARILNQNYVNGSMTATIAWNLIASYYHGLDYYRSGLMTAAEPWSGHYIVNSPIWVTAHTTQFSSAGWKYLQHGSGVGYLPDGGSYVGLVSPSGNDLTIVIETMTHDHSVCVRPDLSPYNVTTQNVTITLKGHFANISELHVWYTQLTFGEDESKTFVSRGPVKVVNGVVQLSLDLDQIYTLTTLSSGLKGSYPKPPPSSLFPLPYKDDFEANNVNDEPFNLAQQSGSFEVLRNGSNQFIRQMVLSGPIRWMNWCLADTVGKAISLVGNNMWYDVFVEIDFSFPDVNASSGVFVAARVSQGGCGVGNAQGIFFFATENDHYILSKDLAKKLVVTSGNLPSGGGWHRLSLFVQGPKAYGVYDGNALFAADLDLPGEPEPGFVAIGSDSFGLADFDNLYIASSPDGVSKMNSYFQASASEPLYFINENN